jgi:holo-[acyl-carrier protein] synthase
VIAGIGIDLVDVERIAKLLERNGPAFARRIVGPTEDASSWAGAAAAARLATLFAAKEAVMKALGTGMAGAAFRDIAIRVEGEGAPRVVLSGDALETARRKGIASWRLSITHAGGTAAAVAIAVANG